MRITLIEPFFSGSHQQWAEGIQAHSQHQIELLTLPGRFWKWRMHGAAVKLAEQFLTLPYQPDLILASDMLDLGNFLALTRRKSANIPTALYFHENQITYPWSPRDQVQERNNQYGFINYTSALNADQVFFNSQYHLQSFLEALPPFLRQFPDFRSMANVERIEKKSRVLPLGLDLKKFDLIPAPPKPQEAVLLWNHRWEFDKQPEPFFQALFRLKAGDIPFKLVLLGEAYAEQPPVFAEAIQRLGDAILHQGYTESFTEYAQYLRLADILPVTSQQDFFGGSVVEAMYCQTFPLVPDRLAYPEHIPADKKSTHVFKADQDLFPILKNRVTALENTRTIATSIPSYVEHYDWGALIDQYDQYLSEASLNR